MGCDIHIWAEKKVGDGTYEYYGEVSCNRSYRLFDCLCGVRGDDAEVARVANRPRGLPGDMAIETVLAMKEDTWCDESHSHSWVTADEFLFALQQATGKHWNHWLPTVAEVEALPAGSRLIFWFDN